MVKFQCRTRLLRPSTHCAHAGKVRFRCSLVSLIFGREGAARTQGLKCDISEGRQENLMDKITRRTTIATALGALAVNNAASAAPAKVDSLALGTPKRVPPPGKAGIQFALMQGVGEDHKARLGKQLGVNYAISGMGGALNRVPRTEYEAAAAKVVASFK